MVCVECARKAQARGLCNTHYHRARRAWIEDGIDLFPARDERASAVRLRPPTCRYRACVRPVHLHSVCVDHLVVTLAAGRRAQAAAPRLSVLVSRARPRRGGLKL